MNTKDFKLYDKVVLDNGGNKTLTTFVVFIDYAAEIIHLRDNDIFDWTKRSFTFNELDSHKPIKIGKSIVPLASIPFAWCTALFFVLWAIINFFIPALIIAGSVCTIWSLFRSGYRFKKKVSRVDELEKLLKQAKKKEAKEVDFDEGNDYN